MSCNALVRAECANFKKGRCVLSGRLCPVLEDLPCDIPYRCAQGETPAPSGEPTYFEVAVLPLSKSMIQYASCPAEYAGFKGETAKVNIRKCSCGKPMLPRHRMCEKCADNKARESTRKYKLIKKG